MGIERGAKALSGKNLPSSMLGASTVSEPNSEPFFSNQSTSSAIFARIFRDFAKVFTDFDFYGISPNQNSWRCASPPTAPLVHVSVVNKELFFQL